MGHQQQENLAGEKQKQLEYELQCKDQQINALKDQLKDKQNEHKEKLHALQEELEIERENGI